MLVSGKEAIWNIDNPKIRAVFLAVIVCFLLLSFPFSDGSSHYAYSELQRDLDVVRTIDQGKLVQLGPVSSLGDFHFGPAYYYLLYPFVKVLAFQPYSLAAASSFFMLLTVMGTFILVRKWSGNELLGLLSAATMAFSNLTFQLTKYASNPNFIPFWTVVFFYSLHSVINKPRSSLSIAVLALSAAILTQLHAVTLVTVPCVILCALVQTDLKKVGYFGAGLFLTVLVIAYYPYLSYELPSNFANTKELFKISESPQIVGTVDHLIQLIGFTISSVVSTHGFFDAVGIAGVKFLIGLAAIMFLGLVVFRYNNTNRQDPPSGAVKFDHTARVLLKLWVLVPLAVYLLPVGGTANYHYYYFFVLFPLVFIGLGWLVYKSLEAGLRNLGFYVIGAFVLVQFIQVFIYICHVNQHRM